VRSSKAGSSEEGVRLALFLVAGLRAETPGPLIINSATLCLREAMRRTSVSSPPATR